MGGQLSDLVPSHSCQHLRLDEVQLDLYTILRIAVVPLLRVIHR